MIEGIPLLLLADHRSVEVLLERLDFVAGMYHRNLAIQAMNTYPYDHHHGLYSFSVKADLQEAGALRLPHCLGSAGKLKLGNLEAQRDEGLLSIMSSRYGSPSSKRALMAMSLQLVRPIFSSRF
jgi:hypothetical protein